MRENMGKYHGKRKDNGEWVEGFYSCVTDNYTPKNRCYITRFKTLDNGEIVLTGQFEVIPETVGQFTGLTDRNGKNIFEGDILSFADVLGFVNYNYGCYCVKTNKPDWHSRTNPAIDIIMCEYEEKVEIVGNIYDNSELISGDENAD